MAKIGLKTLVAELIDAKDSSSQEFRRLYNIGVRGLREFNSDVVGTFVTALLPVKKNRGSSCYGINGGMGNLHQPKSTIVKCRINVVSRRLPGLHTI